MGVVRCVPKGRGRFDGAEEQAIASAGGRGAVAVAASARAAGVILITFD